MLWANSDQYEFFLAGPRGWAPPFRAGIADFRMAHLPAEAVSSRGNEAGGRMTANALCSKTSPSLSR